MHLVATGTRDQSEIAPLIMFSLWRTAPSRCQPSNLHGDRLFDRDQTALNMSALRAITTDLVRRNELAQSGLMHRRK